MLEGAIEIEGMGISGWGCYVSMQLAVVTGLAEPMTVFVETRPSEKPRQVVCSGAGAGVASGIVDHADKVQPVLQGRDGDPT